MTVLNKTYGYHYFAYNCMRYLYMLAKIILYIFNAYSRNDKDI